MRILYPENPLDKAQADGPYQEEFKALTIGGYTCSLFDFDMLQFGEFKPHPQLPTGEQILYRGWMLSPEGYEQLASEVTRKKARLITSYKHYLRCHHLPHWYQQCASLTAKTHFFPYDDALQRNLEQLGWTRYFIKDFVKSNTAELGSIANSPTEALKIVEEIAQYRGQIEGGIAVRQVESYKPGTEQRYFIVRGRPFSQNQYIPDIIRQVADIVDAPFYSADIVENTAGDYRLVELGDGQVSDKKNWPLSKFIDVIAAIAAS
ncbi:MAG: ATP-grasp domain-containing protein [Cyanobacteria bacterium J06632_3]